METKYVLYSLQTNSFLTAKTGLTKDYFKAQFWDTKEETINYLKVNSRIIKAKTGSKFWTTREFFII